MDSNPELKIIFIQQARFIYIPVGWVAPCLLSVLLSLQGVFGQECRSWMLYGRLVRTVCFSSQEQQEDG